MENSIVKKLAQDNNLNTKQIETVLNLLGEGATVPFIARYRKDVTGSLDEDQIRMIETEYKYQLNLADRKSDIIRLIDEKGLLTDKLISDINAATKLQTIEDIYLPYKEKKKTKATTAIANGLEPLAKKILGVNSSNLDQLAKSYVNDKVTSVDEALEGAGYIIAEWVSENAKTREYIRKNANMHGVIEVKAKRKIEELDPNQKYEMYYDFSQQVRNLPGYRILAFNRGEREKLLNVKLVLDIDYILERVAKRYIRTSDEKIVNYIQSCIKDSLKRLILPSIERETRKMLTENAEAGAISLFAQNLDKLIMQPPCKDAWILGVDPAFRTGCKLAVISPQGKLEAIDVIYPHPNKGKESQKDNLWNKSEAILLKLSKKFKIDQIVIGNGTASRETEEFFKQRFAIAPIHIISEAGASVYSASKLAQEEFPDLQVEQRSAASIARRYLDPMAELVKIDPQSIGVGQYQHDVNQKLLAENLNFVMIKNINKVGVDLNTASVELLKYVSGLDRSVAKNIVAYREEHGRFNSRRQLKDVKRLGKKAFDNCAGFLKIADGDNSLDATFIHPENYKLAEKILKEFGMTKNDLGTEAIALIINGADKDYLATTYDVSRVVITDILEAFKQPMLDIRNNVVNMEFDTKVKSIDDLAEGMTIVGQVRNIVEFGAFVDIGIKNDGLVHISQLSNKYVDNVSDIVSIGDIVKCNVVSIDTKKNKVQLSMKDVK